MVKNLNYTKVKLQLGSNRQYRITIPSHMVKKNLLANKGDLLSLDIQGESIIIRKDENQYNCKGGKK
jgi:bifunctional DNA-binding transcriptional regulator/antitoxin component of YhaV-PrlF toxin-antitoxin module